MGYLERAWIRCDLGGGVTVARRISTTLWNERERERIVAIKAYYVFCCRGREHGFDLNDWLEAEREVSVEANDVVITASEAGFDISIADRPKACIVLSMAPSNLLVVWVGDDPDDPMGQDTDIDRLTLHLVSLPELGAPEKVEVTYEDGRVWLHLPRVTDGHRGLEHGGDPADRREVLTDPG